MADVTTSGSPRGRRLNAYVAAAPVMAAALALGLAVFCWIGLVTEYTDASSFKALVSRWHSVPPGAWLASSVVGLAAGAIQLARGGSRRLVGCVAGAVVIGVIAAAAGVFFVALALVNAVPVS